MPDTAAHPSLASLSWFCGEDPMCKSVWFTAGDVEHGIVLTLFAPSPSTWLGAAHTWSWTLHDRSGVDRRPGPVATSPAAGFASAADALAGLAAAYEGLVSSRQVLIAA